MSHKRLGILIPLCREKYWVLPMDHNLTPISLDDPFRYECSETVPCFNECCRDLNQFLSPYDILRLKSHLGMSANDFLAQYCSQHTGPESGLPIITLKPKEAPQLTCPFVTPAGCRVYPDRPSSCRTYPLVRAISKSRETGKISEHFMVIKEPHCLGFHEKKEQTVRQWIEHQGITVYNEFNDMLMEIISLKNRLIPGPLDIKSRYIFHLALYDLDNFRSQIFVNDLLNDFDVDQKLLEDAKTSDVALLMLGLTWVKREVFDHS
jgi:Fe-S-cluster containining protein